MPTGQHNDDGESTVHQAVRSGDIGTLMPAVRVEPDSIDRECDEFTPLQLAVWRGETEMVTLLLSHGADPNRCQSDGMRPLDRALDFGLDQIVESLRSSGAVESAP